MVRVISVHHFASQDIQVVEQPTASTVAYPNRLLLALTSNCVEVRDLGHESEVLFSFPTVDEVVKIVHSINGDYIATLETKFNRQNKETNFVRVYINWDSIAALQQSKMTSSGVSLGSSECGMVQPMRARIAGRVTPTTNQSELGSLEMIEIPVRENPSDLECCPISGNLAVLSRKTLTFFQFQVKTHDISKLKFIDFEEHNLKIELSFVPKKMLFCENYLAFLNADTLHLFRIVEPAGLTTSQTTEEFNFLCNSTGTIDYQQLLKDDLHHSKDKLTVNLPSILKENSLIHKNNPFTFSDKDIKAEIKSQFYTIQNLIQLKLKPILIENAQRTMSEEFKCMILKPLYLDEHLKSKSQNNQDKKNFLKSDFQKSLNSLVFMVATQQEGYLYFFNDGLSDFEQENCIAVYPFTSPVQKLVMEDAFLHALTETGLESYTLRFGHKLFKNFEIIDNVNVACPSINDSVCLVGLRPFLEVETVLLAKNHLVLLANSETSPTHSVSSNSSSNAAFWTLYNLELPGVKTVFNDVSIVANVHRFSSAQTYCHLLSEAHVILRVSLILKTWTWSEDNVKLIMQFKGNLEDIVETYRTSCALLADHFMLCSNEEDYSLAIPYYKMARVLPGEVLKRVKKIQEQANSQATKGLINYLKTILLEVKSSCDADRFFGSNCKQNFSENILELLQGQGFEDLPNLILKSKILREYSTEKLITILEKHNFSNSNRSLALTCLYIQKCNTEKALDSLKTLRKDKLFELLLEHHELLFETSFNPVNKNKTLTTFSELTVLLISLFPEMLSEILVFLIVEKKFLTLHKIIKVFLEYLPSSIGSDTNSASILLQKTLEQYFEQYFSRPENVDLSKVIYEKGASEAMKLLVRSYMSQLQILQMKEHSKLVLQKEEEEPKPIKLGYNQINKNYFEESVKKPKETFLFATQRFEYLDKMPPFQIEITQKLYQTLEQQKQETFLSVNEEADAILKKLQALLCSQVVPKQVLLEVSAFLEMNETLRGNYSLQSIILSTNEAILLLIEVCPQSLLQFGKDRFTKPDEWKFLIATIQKKILSLSQNDQLNRICFFYKKLLKDVLTFVASSMTLDQLVLVLPQRFSTSNQNEYVGESELDQDLLNEIQNYEPFVVVCKETMHANKVNQLITTTGQQLLCNLSL